MGDCRVDTRRGKVTRDGRTFRLEPQVLAFLNLLLEHPAEVVSRDQS